MYEEVRRRILKEFERRISEFLGERPSWDMRSRSMEPLTNVVVARDEVLITADLPMADPQSLRVRPVGESQVEIYARMRRRVDFSDLGMGHMRGCIECFFKLVEIPVSVDVGRMAVKFSRGILEIRIPRK
mgnify:CR=1 FL=1